jgi:hypothetical protein
MKNKNLIISAVLIVLVAAGAFYGGMRYQLSKTPSFARQFNGRGNTARGGAVPNGARQGFSPVNGEIISSDSNSITVKMADGSSKIVILTDSTDINKADTATKSDLTTGAKVAVFGTNNSDGSVTAQSIQINPAFGLNNNTTPTP